MSRGEESRARASATHAVRILLAFVAIVLGCSPAPDPAHSQPPGAQPAARGTPIVESPPDGASLPSAATATSAPGATRCPPVEGEMCRLCSSGSPEPILRFTLADLVAIPASAKVVREQKSAPLGGADKTFTVAADDTSLAAQVFTCPHCRRPMGWGFLVAFTSLARLREADQGALQTALGYAASPRLATRADWEKAGPIRPPGESPALPSCGPN